MTRSVCIHEFGGPEVLRIEEVEVEDAGEGEVRTCGKVLGFQQTLKSWPDFEGQGPLTQLITSGAAIAFCVRVNPRTGRI
jgi:hypothetical protein